MNTADETEKTRKRYDRAAGFFDFMEGPMEARRFSRWRARLRQRLTGTPALEVGVGTGKNMPYYPPGVKITAIDLSPRMLDRARRRAALLGLEVDLLEMDVQDLQFADQTFHTVFATFVFCSVPNPVQGLRELRRVCRPDGRLVLLEHMRPGKAWLGSVFDVFNPLAVRVTGANINRRTMANISRAGWTIEVEENLFSDIVRWIEARP